MNTNVSDMPLDIFADYSSDMLDEEWVPEYLALTTNGYETMYKAGGGYFGEMQYGCGQWMCGDYGHGFGEFQFMNNGSGMQNNPQYGCSLDYYEY